MKTLEEALSERLTERARLRDAERREHEAAIAAQERREAEAAAAFRAHFQERSNVALGDATVACREVTQQNEYNPRAYYQAYIVFPNDGWLRYRQCFSLVDGELICDRTTKPCDYWSAALPGQHAFAAHFERFTDAAIYALQIDTAGIPVQMPAPTRIAA